MWPLNAPYAERWADRAAVACAVAYGAAVWWPTRQLPYYWDSATFVVDAARDLRASGFHPLIATHSDFAHPPLLVALLAAVWSLFGESRGVSHALVLPALPLAMVATYRLGIRFADRGVGAAAAALLGGTAIVVTEQGEVYMDLPAAALLTWGLVAWLGKRRMLAALLFTAAALMKIPAPLTVPGTLGLMLLADRQGRRDVRGMAALALPFVADALWVGYHAAVTGWALWRPGRTIAAPRGVIGHAAALGTVFDWLLLGQWRWVLIAAAVIAAIWMGAIRKWPIEWRPVLPLVGVVLAGVVFFGVVGEFGLRYGMYLLPPYFVATLTLVRGAFARSGWVLLGAGLLFALFATTWHPKAELTTSYVFRPDENLVYLDTIRLGERASRWLERKHPQAEIIGAGPESYELTEPWQGYVQTPLRFTWCKSFEPHPGSEQIVILHPYHPQQPLCRRIVDVLGAAPLGRFVENGKWLELYMLDPAPPSAEQQK